MEQSHQSGTLIGRDTNDGHPIHCIPEIQVVPENSVATFKHSALSTPIERLYHNCIHFGHFTVHLRRNVPYGFDDMIAFLCRICQAEKLTQTASIVETRAQVLRPGRYTILCQADDTGQLS